MEILRDLRDKYEAHHGVEISEEALTAAARLSHRYATRSSFSILWVTTSSPR